MADIDCTRARDLFDALLDGEAPPDRQGFLNAHLQSCPDCRTALERRQSMLTLFRDAAPRLSAPPGLRASIMAALPVEEAPRRIVRPNWQWGAWGASAAALAASVMLVFSTPGPGDQLRDDLAAAHIRSLIGTHMVDVETSDRHTVKPWFNGKTNLSPPVVDLADAGFPLVGGRLDYVGGETAAVLVYRRNQHVLNLFLWPEHGGPAMASAGRKSGYDVISWEQDGLNAALVSDLNHQELSQFQSLWRNRIKDPH